MPAAISRRFGGPPLGLAQPLKRLRAVQQGQASTWDDVAIDTATAYRPRRARERCFSSTA